MTLAKFEVAVSFESVERHREACPNEQTGT